MLDLSTITVNCADFGQETCVPDILESFNIQNKSHFELDEYDEIYEGYGQLRTGYPYKKYTGYTREATPKGLKAAVLENDHLRAVFLPEFGGRLWQLTDKTAGRELLYTNDVLRASNLAVREAWFSGGVEWNVGVIGHTPLTVDSIFAARLKMPDGGVTLRLYAYERIRRVVYQMDFWLSDDAPLLNCRMRIANETPSLVPMYWWSNIAVPEHEGGRIFVPAETAYTSTRHGAAKTAVPYVDGIDISRYKSLPKQIDYFFSIPKTSPKFIANVDATGYGLLHVSSSKLQSRKLFSWGKTDGAARWQSFLTENGGPYIEIQAGLGKTQYGCIPMAPNTAWEWTEQYGPLQLSQEQQEKDFKTVSGEIAADVIKRDMDALVMASRSWVKSRGEVLHRGNADALLENELRAAEGMSPMSPHLDFGSEEEKPRVWREFLKTGTLKPPEHDDPPTYFVWDSFWLSKLAAAAQDKETNNWFLQYHLGLQYWQAEDFQRAHAAFDAAQKLQKTPWGHHALAVLSLRRGETACAVRHMQSGLALRRGDLAYLKEALRVFADAGAWREMREAIDTFTGDTDSRIELYLAKALHELGYAEKAMAILTQNGGLEVADIREGEDSIGVLWRAVHRSLTGEEKAEIPHVFNFNTQDI